MKQYYYYKALRKSIMQWLDLFNDIQVNRYNHNGTFLKRVKIPLQYGPKEKHWYWVNQRKDDEMLPALGATLTGIEYSLERQTNKHRIIWDRDSVSAGTTLRRYLNPVPYDLSFQLGIWSLYMVDIDQVLEQILPFFQPFVYMRVPIEELFNSSFEAKVLFTGGSPEFDSEYADEGRRVLKYTLEFQVQTYLFKPIESAGFIKDIYINYYLNKNAFKSRLASSTFTSGASGESQHIFGPSADDPDIWKYEVYQFGNKIGKTITYGD